MNARFCRTLLTVIAGVIIAIQWRSVRQVRHENQRLRIVREELEETRTELTNAVHAAEVAESDAELLRVEVNTLRSDLEILRFEFGRATNAIRPRAFPVGRSSSKANDVNPLTRPRYLPPPPNSALGPNHLYPDVLTNLPPKLPGPWHASASFIVDGVKLYNRIEKRAVLSGTAWSLSEPLPLSFVDAEKIARGELRRLLQDEPDWSVHTIYLNQLYGNEHAWYYSLSFHPDDWRKKGTFIVNVSFSGIIGTTTLSDEQE